jgi:hypothetical protein
MGENTLQNKYYDDILMCKCADVQMCKFLRSIALLNLHICTFAHLHIKKVFPVLPVF